MFQQQTRGCTYHRWNTWENQVQKRISERFICAMGQMYTSSVIISNKPYITMRWKQAIVSCSGVFFALNERNGTFYHCSGSGCHRVSCHTLAWLTKKCNTGMTKSKDHSRYYPLPTKTVGCLKAFLTLSSLCNIPVWFIFFFLKGRLGKRLLNLPVTFLRIRRGYIKADFEVLAKLFYSIVRTTYYYPPFIYFHLFLLWCYSFPNQLFTEILDLLHHYSIVIRRHFDISCYKMLL